MRSNNEECFYVKSFRINKTMNQNIIKDTSFLCHTFENNTFCVLETEIDFTNSLQFQKKSARNFDLTIC